MSWLSAAPKSSRKPATFFTKLNLESHFGASPRVLLPRRILPAFHPNDSRRFLSPLGLRPVLNIQSPGTSTYPASGVLLVGPLRFGDFGARNRAKECRTGPIGLVIAGARRKERRSGAGGAL